MRGGAAAGCLVLRTFLCNTYSMAKIARVHREPVVELPVALKFSINLSSDVGSVLKQVAFDNRVSESSVVEVALRQLLRRVSHERLGAYLKQNGACLRRRT